ncbi:polyphosphate polymerase domain-containing protein [Candidatus Gracilibacteria bacterium]|nr:polyphosphate polymerase domain-containing protein [Candidatus Gracilibacteria bacterium]
MTDFVSTLSEFSQINLEQLNASASFLDRIDRKFLLTEKQLEDILKEFDDDFYVLEIAGQKIFSYDNVYMDTLNYKFYNDHQNKAKSRVKVRTRLYKDADLSFFEFKQKQKEVTRKFRYQIPVEEHAIMTKEAKGFYKGVYMSFYSEKAEKISPAIRTSYSRMTLVSKDSSERLTIDFNIKTQDLRKSHSPHSVSPKGREVIQDEGEISLTNLVIVESKSMSEKCKSIDIITSHGIKKAKSCSKYSLGVVYSGLAEKFSTFENTMEEIKRIKQDIDK